MSKKPFKLISGVEIPREDIPIWEAYNFCCVAHPATLGVCLHEEPPKSLNPKWYDQPEKRFVVCNACHVLLHDLSRENAALYLSVNRTTYHPNAEEMLCQLREQRK